MNPSKPSDILPEPPEHLKRHSDRLVARMVERIDREGPISFATFMEMALYEPGLGYYSAGLHKFGREGDFVTAPELGDIFADCLARQIAEIGEHLGEYEILEIGAGSGKLASQLVSKLHVGASFSSRQPPGRDESRAKARSYKILERSADLRAVQRKTIEQHAPQALENVEWLDEPPSKPWQGVIVANEVVDALPAERFRIAGGDVRQVCVTHGNDRLTLTDRLAPAELETAVQALGPQPDGYTSEINPLLAPWLATSTDSLESGVALFVDYGYPRSEYYLPERNDGTLISHYRHRAHPDVLRWPGLQDITAFVDFTALAEAGNAAGLDLLGYTSQALFLLACGLDAAVQTRLDGEPGHDMAVNNEVRQLVMPELMGEKFQVMALGRSWPDDVPLRGFSFRDLRNRL